MFALQVRFSSLPPPYHSAFTSIHRRTHVRIYMLYVHVVDNDEDDDVATPHRSLKTGGIWQRPGRDCSWSCPSNHIKWKRDQFVEECVQCPPETFDQDALAVAEGPPERESVDRERER